MHVGGVHELEVQVREVRAAGIADGGDGLTAPHRVASLHLRTVVPQVCIGTEDAAAVIDDDVVAEQPLMSCRLACGSKLWSSG